MNTNAIISSWSYDRICKSINDVIIEKSIVLFERDNNIKLTNLNIIGDLYNDTFWYISNETKLYLFSLSINGNIDTPQLSTIKNALNEIGINDVFMVVIDIIKYDEQKKYDIIEIKPKEISIGNKPRNTIKYMVCDFRIEEKNIASLRTNRYHKRTNQTNASKWDNMVSASSTRNYLLRDPLLDYLNEYNIHSIDDKPIKKTYGGHMGTNDNIDIFTKTIMDAGNEYERELIKYLEKHHTVTTIGEIYHARNEGKAKETIDAMKRGDKIIYQGVLHNWDNETYGMPDLIIRSDFINELFGYNVIDKDEENAKSIFSNNYHYKIIDIKHSMIHLCADKTHMLNINSIPAYKGQIYIYVMALNNIQKVNINKGFIWGKSYQYNKGPYSFNINNPLNKLGVIDYNSKDIEYCYKTQDAIEWIRTLRSEGHNWPLLPVPSRRELYPNMKNEHDGKYGKIKGELGKRIHDITNIYYCGVKERDKAFDADIYGWNNKRLTAEIMGHKNKRAKVINEILKINRQDDKLYNVSKVIYDRDNWYKKNNFAEFYIDFETFNSNFACSLKDGLYLYDENHFIFMIGLGFMDNNKWIFKTFLMKEKTSFEQVRVINDMFNYIKNIAKNKEAKLYHWSQAEPSNLKSIMAKHNIHTDCKYRFYDLNNVFKEEPIAIKGCMNFKLKAISKILYENGIIKTIWDSNSPCSNGLNAMILAENVYKQKKNIDGNPVMKDIIHYNEVDCRVLEEIHSWMRKIL